jgi:hypothetical protein
MVKKRFYLLLVVVGGLLSGCCHGQWCFSPIGTKKAEEPPAAINDDRTGGIDPRLAPPANDAAPKKAPDPEKEILAQ